MSNPRVRLRITVEAGEFGVHFAAVRDLLLAELEGQCAKADVDPARAYRVEELRECQARVNHGPGHQSRTRCARTDEHELHAVHLDVAGRDVFWLGDEGTTGPFDESPEEEP